MTVAALAPDACYVGDASGQVQCAGTSRDPPASRPIWTRGRAAVRCILPVDLLARNGSGTHGLAVGDASGTVGYYQDGRLVCEHALPLAITALSHHVDGDGGPAVAAADVGGAILVFGLLASPVWRIRLQDAVAACGIYPRFVSAVALASIGAPPRTGPAAPAASRRLVVAADGGLLALIDERGEMARLLVRAADGTRAADGGPPSGTDGYVAPPDVELTALGQGTDSSAGATAGGAHRAGCSLPVACSDGWVRVLRDAASPAGLGQSAPREAYHLETLAHVGVRVSAICCGLWRELGALACVGHFDGALLLSCRAEPGGAATEPGRWVCAIRHVMPHAGWTVAVRLERAPPPGCRGEGGDAEADEPVLECPLLLRAVSESPAAAAGAAPQSGAEARRAVGSLEHSETLALD